MTKNSPKIVIKGVAYYSQILDVKGGHYWYTLESTNGQIDCTSEMYTRKHDAKRAALKLSNKFGMTNFQLVDETAKKKK